MADLNADAPIWVSIAAMVDWTELPELKTKFELSLESVVSEWREDLIQRGWDTDVFEKPLLKRLRRIDSVVFGELSFRPYIEESTEGRFPSRQLRWSKLAAKTLKQLSDYGALALYYDGAGKAYTPEMFEQIDVKDHATLFHLFVEIWGDGERVGTEGMSIFGLPEVCISGVDPSSATAQATVFSLAAQLVCDELKVLNRMRFQASESFPWCLAEWIASPEKSRSFMYASSEEADPNDDGGDASADTMDFPCGLVVLRPEE